MIYNIVNYVKQQHYAELAACSPVARQVKLLKLMVEEMPLHLDDTDQFACRYGFEEGTVLLPKTRVVFSDAYPLSEEITALKAHLDRVNHEVMFTRAHTCVDYGMVLQYGLKFYVEKVETALNASPENEMLLAMKGELEIVLRCGERFAALAKERWESAKTEESRRRFGTIYEALCHVPQNGARTFLEAVQSLWIVHCVIPMSEMDWASISLGRLDQYLYPFYVSHLQNGGTREEAKAILKQLFRLLDTYGDGACALNIGGMDANGNDQMNDLSRLLIEVEKELCLRAPIFAVRVTPNMPNDVLDELIDPALFSVGQPTFYGEESCRRALLTRGVEDEEAVNFSVSSCMGLVVSGSEFSDMWGVKFNAHLPLELAVNGQPFDEKEPVSSAIPVVAPTSFETIVEQFLAHTAEQFSRCADVYHAIAHHQAKNTPNPLVSALTKGCVEARGDRSVSAKYNSVTVELFGMMNACNALLAIRELVFQKKLYTLEQLVTAAKANYVGYDRLRNDVIACIQYGENNADTNEFCKDICHRVYLILKDSRRGNHQFLPSLHTLEGNVTYGKRIGPTLDGRLSGEPLCKNANPSPLLKSWVHTNVVLSATALDQHEFSGGQPIDLYFDKDWFAIKETRDKIRGLIVTYLQLGGLQLQVNSADVELLKRAHETPDQYPQLIVRIGGFSMYFCDLPPAVREEFIQRFQQMQ